jgi:hypothetical protein
LRNHFFQFRTAGFVTRSFFLKNHFAACFGEGTPLQFQILVFYGRSLTLWGSQPTFV